MLLTLFTYLLLLLILYFFFQIERSAENPLKQDILKSDNDLTTRGIKHNLKSMKEHEMRHYRIYGLRMAYNKITLHNLQQEKMIAY